MRLSRLGSFHQSRLSFMRVLIRRMAREGWRITRPMWDLDPNGVGTALYTVDTGARRYTLVAFGHDLPNDQRTDRVIAEAWDATFTLFDGVPEADDLDRLRANVPLQEAGRITGRELCLSRANRSVRAWTHVTGRLAQGLQPDPQVLDPVGYLMRTTAVYGSGKFGAADRAQIADRPEFRSAFQVEMLTVYLIRLFVADLADHVSAAMGGAGAARLDPAIRRGLGIGNSTGLGMAPFLVNHPALLHAWIAGRETALARVCALAVAGRCEVEAFRAALGLALANARDWPSVHPYQRGRIRTLIRDLGRAVRYVNSGGLRGPYPWRRLMRWAGARLGSEGQEALVSLLLEPYGALVDDLGEGMFADEAAAFRIDGRRSVAEARAAVDRHMDWALRIPFGQPAAQARFWYVSQAKQEPRLGERYDEDGAALEQPLDIARAVRGYRGALAQADGGKSLAEFLLEQPQHRRAARRAQIATRMPYSEIRDNLLDAGMMPIDMLRCKLSFFGATRFDPRSDRWVRICMYRNAPFPDDLAAQADHWAYASGSGGP